MTKYRLALFGPKTYRKTTPTTPMGQHGATHNPAEATLFDTPEDALSTVPTSLRDSPFYQVEPVEVPCKGGRK